MTHLKSLGARFAKFAAWWAAMKFAFFLGAVCMALYMGGLIFAVSHFGTAATVQKVHSLSGGRL